MGFLSGFTPKVPSLYIQNEGEDVSTKVALSLTRAPQKFIVRLTGGCGDMSAEDAQPLYDLFCGGFDGAFKGALVFGGTQMRWKHAPNAVLPGITEVAPRIARECPESVVLGLVPRQEDLQLCPYGMIVNGEGDKPFFTIVHPEQSMCLVIQHSVDKGVMWDSEFLMCADIVEHLRNFADWKSVLIAYNGGGTTEREIRFWAERNWPVIIIANSGRASSKLSEDEDFLRAHPSVQVVDNYAPALRLKLAELGAIQLSQAKLRLVR